MITGKIDLGKITGAKVLKKDGRIFVEVTDSKLFEGKTGALYLDLTLWDTPGDKFGNDWRIVQSVSQEARQRGEKGPILGNGKNRGSSGGGSAPQAAPKQNVTHTAMKDDSGDIPF